MASRGTKRPSKNEDLISHEGAQFIKAVSEDGMEFLVDARCFESSKPITELISKSRIKDENGLPVIHLEADGEVLEKMIQYFYYKTRWDKNPDERPAFHIDPTLALNLMVCSYKYGA